MTPVALRAAHDTLREEFCSSVCPELRQDDVENAEWRRRMFAVLVPHGEDVASEEEMLGLGAEFYMQVEWLPGGRIEEGELILDPVLDEIRPAGGHVRPTTVDYSQARGLLFNLVREYGDLEYRESRTHRRLDGAAALPGRTSRRLRGRDEAARRRRRNPQDHPHAEMGRPRTLGRGQTAARSDC